MSFRLSPCISLLLSGALALCGNFFVYTEAKAQSAEQLLQQGNDLANNGECIGASKLYSQAINIDSQLSRAYFNRANCIRYGFPNKGQCIGPKDLELVLADYSKALEIEPFNTEYLQKRGHCRAEMKKYNDAISDYTRAIKISPTWYFYLSRGETKIEMGDKEGGCAEYELMPESGIPAFQKKVDIYSCA